MEGGNQASPRRGRVLLIVGAALVALVAGAWIALAILLPPARVRALVEQELTRTLAREVRFADARVGLFPPVRLTVSGIAVSEAGGFSKGTLFLARSLHLDLDVFALLSRRVSIRRLALDEPGLHLVLGPNGTTNLDGLVRPAPERKAQGPAFDLSIQELSLRRARLLVDDLVAGTRRTALIDSRIALDASGQGRVTTSGRTTISGVAFGRLTAATLGGLNQALAGLEAHVEHRGIFDSARHRLALERLDLEMGRTRLGLHGVVDEPGPKARFDLRAKGEGVDFGEVLGWLAKADARAVRGVHGAGRLDFDLAIRGGAAPSAGREVAGTLAVSGASFRYPGAPVGVDGLGFSARLARDSVGIGDLVARVGGQPIRGSLSATRFRDPWVRFALRGDVDLAAVSPLVASEGTKLAGRMGLDVSGSGRAKDPGAMALSGAARLTGVSVESPKLPRRVEGVEGRLRFAASRAEVEGLAARAGKSSLALDGRVDRPLALLAKPDAAAPSRVEFDFRSPYLDVADFLPPQSGPPIVLNASGGGHVRIDRLINQKLDVADVRADVTLEPGIIRAQPFSMKAYSGTVGGTARLDLRDPAKPGVSVNAKLDSLSADALVSAWTPARGFLHGSLNTALDLAVEGATPDQMMQTLTATGLAQLMRGQVGPGPVLTQVAQFVRIPALERLAFDEAKLPLRIERGRVVTDPAVLRGSYGEWKVVGAVGFDGALDYAVSATLPPAATQALAARSALAAGALTDNEGNLLIDLRVGGSARSPKLSWDTAAMKDRLLGKASHALEQQGRKLEQEIERAALTRPGADSLAGSTPGVTPGLTDSLKRKATDILHNFFGGGAKDTTKR